MHKEFVKCKVCGIKFKRINSFHLKKHGLSIPEYIIKFPKARLLSDHQKSICGWQKGLTKETNESLRKMSDKVSNTCKNKFDSGYEVWNKGLTKDNSEVLNKMSKNRLGFKHTDETKEKIRKTSIEHWKDSEYREKVIKNASIGIIKSYKNGNRKGPINKDTKPELVVESVLKKMNIKYTKQFPIWFEGYFIDHEIVRFYDFYLPDYNTLIEVHGDYWHGRIRKNNKLSKIQEETIANDLIKWGIAWIVDKKIEYIWEFETKKEEIIYEKINQILHPPDKLPLRLSIETVQK